MATKQTSMPAVRETTESGSASQVTRTVIPAGNESAQVVKYEQVSESGRRTVTEVHLLAEVIPLD